MKELTPVSLTAPGFYGLNTQDSPTDMDQRFMLDATNCVIDKSGRLASRKGWAPQHTADANLSTASVDAMGELIDTDGTSYVIVAGNNKLFRFTGSALTLLTYGGGGSAPVITASNWQMCTLNRGIVLFQIGHDPLIFDLGLSATQFRRLSEHPTYSGTAPLADCGISALGRVWAGRTSTNKVLVQWTDTGTHQKWTGGTAGSLDLTTVWPAGADEIMGLAVHNNSLIIFGRRQILIYQGATNPATMSLQDTITNIGCVSRDSIQMTGEDVIFLSDSGVRSIARTIQEKSAPLRTISRNVNDDIMGYVGTVNAVDVKSVYSPVDNFYLIAFRGATVAYCFDMRSPLQDGSARTTLWTSITPRSFLYTSKRQLLIGKAGYVGLYSGYTDNGALYRMSFASGWMDFGSPIRLSILKKIKAIVLGAQNQPIVLKWGYDYVSNTGSETYTLTNAVTLAQYGIAEYAIAEYNANLLTNEVSINPTGSGRVVQIGFEANMTSYSIAVQKMDIFTKEGRM